MTTWSEHLHSRKARLGSYAALLTLLVVYLVLRPVLEEGGNDTRWFVRVVFPLLLLVSLSGIVRRRRPALLIAMVIGVGILLNVVAAPGDSPTVELLWIAVRIVGLALLLSVIFRHIFTSGQVTGDLIVGAACGFLLLALGLGLLFELTEHLAPGSFTAVAGTSDRNYFSIVTLTTLGYGDVLPIRPTARIVAALGAFVGQFYVAVIVARLVALHVAGARESSRD